MVIFLLFGATRGGLRSWIIILTIATSAIAPHVNQVSSTNLAIINQLCIPLNHNFSPGSITIFRCFPTVSYGFPMGFVKTRGGLSEGELCCDNVSGDLEYFFWRFGDFAMRNVGEMKFFMAKHAHNLYGLISLIWQIGLIPCSSWKSSYLMDFIKLFL